MRRGLIGFLAAMVLLPGLGCVAVQAPAIELDSSSAPAGKAQVLIATPAQAPVSPSADLRLTVNDTLSWPLQYHAINRLTLPAGWFRFQLRGIPTDSAGSEISYRFDMGQTYRFAIVSRSESSPDDTSRTGDRTIHSRIVPVTREALRNLVIESSYPVVDVTR